jgi:hypothetical protein
VQYNREQKLFESKRDDDQCECTIGTGDLITDKYFVISIESTDSRLKTLSQLVRGRTHRSACYRICCHEGRNESLGRYECHVRCCLLRRHDKAQ